jgi:cytochrome c-type biogenesis protein CcmH/NrfF
VKRLLPTIALSLSLASWVAPPSFAKPRDPAHAITSELICPCSCGEVLSGCTCETGRSMQATVENGIKQGKGEDQIVGALVAQYGEVIRGAPKPEGFNLIVWVAPFAATLLGFALAFLILQRWVKRRGALSTLRPGYTGDAGPGAGAFPSGRTVEADLDALRARAEAEIRQLRR